jgi:hypothetical protein
MVRELGLERRETVRSLSAVKKEKKKALAPVREDRDRLIYGLAIIFNKVCCEATLKKDNC